MNKTQIRLPLLLAGTLVLGILIGSEVFTRFKYGEGTRGNVQKFRDVLNYIDRYYVDSVNLDELTKEAITEMLHKLDPHTSYVPAKEYQHAFAQLEGGFDGIGIEFNVFRDTIKVLSVQENGPSEKAGLQSGDRIVAINGTKVAGVGITNSRIVQMLRGKKGTEVSLQLFRLTENQELTATVMRDQVTSESVPLSYSLSEKTGYIQISRFARYTHRDFLKALKTLKAQGMEELVLDLRDNSGGYLSQAVAVADELLAGRKEIVYTRGKEKRFNQEERAEKKGLFEEGALVVLINENSASASELLAGALQDYDRALIVGRRSFGKGLVQLPITLEDESVLRLTISRYYTPSGRSIQKSYEDGIDAYRQEVSERYFSGEVFNADSFSLENTTNLYYTENGRTVYGGGGITPDYFIPIDTLRFNSVLNKINEYDIIRDFAKSITEEVRNELIDTKLLEEKHFRCCYNLSEAYINILKSLLKENEIILNDADFSQNKRHIENSVRAYLGREIFSDKVYYAILHEKDNEVLTAAELLEEAKRLND